MRETNDGRVPLESRVYLLDIVAYETPTSNDLSNLENSVALDGIHPDLHPFPTSCQLPQESWIPHPGPQQAVFAHERRPVGNLKPLRNVNLLQ